ncbi:Hypothetical predicted protein [Paramuricea clavata]|uniref:Uncharacterized protein n=1 Tax=Paramuricea clavata TaxID=317549 RepID=A0A6S7I563_PARCT|nr:Hypothetical predicted protein [Paramuricea clavata]
MDQFASFVDYLGFSLTDENYSAYQDLFRSFQQFCNTNPNISRELQFIRWHRQYSTVTQPTVPLLRPDPIHLPTKLATLPNQTCFNTFMLEQPATTPLHNSPHTNMVVKNKSDTPIDQNVLDTTLLEVLNESSEDNEILANSEPVQEQHEITNIVFETDGPPFQKNTNTVIGGYGLGKNIAVLQDEHESRKRKQTKRRRTKTGVRGSGRPTNDKSIMRVVNDGDEDVKTEAVLALKELRLLTSTGVVRKKMPIYTKHSDDIKCFAIKHYSSFEYIADQRKKSLEKIKKHRDILQHLNYLETNMLPYIEQNTTF